MFISSVRQSILSLRTAALATLLAVSAAGVAQASSLHNHPLIVAHRLGAKDVLSAKSAQASVTFTTLDNPGDPTFNQLLSIDDDGTIAGYFGSGLQGHPNQAYIIKAPYTSSFIPANVPASTQTQVQSFITGGTSSGFWAATNTGTDENFGFVKLVSGNLSEYIQVNNPATPAGAAVNQVLGVNAVGHAVGFYLDASMNPHAYLYSISKGAYFPISIAGATADSAFGINGNNVACGDYVTHGITKAFLYNVITGATTTYGYPGSTNTQFLGVNNNGLAVGFYMGSDNLPHGLVYNSVTKTATVVNDPAGLQGTTLNGINSAGEIVGFYTDAAGNFHGLIVTGF
jgi:hypothetical protein